MSKPVHIQKLFLYSYEIPLKTSIFIRGVPFDVKKGLLIHFEDFETNRFWGELSFLPPTEEKIKNAIEWLEKYHDYLLGEQNVPLSGLPPELKFAIESAVDCSGLRDDKISETTLKMNALLAGSFNEIIEGAKLKNKLGYSVFKIKLGEYSLTKAIDLVIRVREIIARDAGIVLDLNRQWELNQTLNFVEHILDKGILYIEDPVETLEELMTYLKVSPVKAGIDEFLERWNLQLESIYKEFSEKLVFVVKPSIVYGTDTWKNFLDSKSCGKVVTSAWETGVGLRGLLKIILRNQMNIQFVGLDTYSYFKYDIVDPVFPITGPQISIKTVQEKFSVDIEKLSLIKSW